MDSPGVKVLYLQKSNWQNRAKPCMSVLTFASGLSVHTTSPFINFGATMGLEAFAASMTAAKDFVQAIS